jgi:hypothetical protein
MLTMTRIQGFSMGYSGFQKPVVQNPGLRGFFDLPMPQLPNFDLPLAAGSPPGGGGADGGGAAPAPAPAPGAAAPAPAPAPQNLAPTFFVPPPNYLFPVQEQPVPPLPPQPTPAPTQAIPTWAIVGGSLLAGLGIAALLFRQG